MTSLKRNFLFVLLIAVTAGLSACTTTTMGQNPLGSGDTASSNRAVMGVRQPKHVGVAMLTANDMLSGRAEQSADRVDIVVCGPGIKALAGDSKFADRVRENVSENMRFKACGITVERMGFDDTRFVDGVQVVPNGFVEIFRLQKKGFWSVEL